MTRLPSILMALSCLAVPAAATADPTEECAAGSQAEIADCLYELEQDVDRDVASSLRSAAASAEKLDARMDRPLMVPALDASQAAWTAYRDAQCEAMGASFGGGSGAGIAIRSCRVTLGRARAEELKTLIF